jgi:phosphate transport system protein
VRRSPGVSVEAVSPRLHFRDPTPPEASPTQSPHPTFDADFEARVVQVWALVGEAIAGATHALLAGDRELAKAIVGNDEAIDELVNALVAEVSRALELGTGTPADRRRLVTLVRTLPELERNGDLAAHIARRAARGLGQEMSPRARGLIERMGEVATTIWRAATDAVESANQALLDGVEELDDELDDLHVSLTGELVSGSMPLPVAVEVAMVARFYERFGDHAVNLANRQPGRSLVD